ncbi:predicted protein [Nematostella vectensis]|uniref:Conodipine-M alpha chain n=1 Tax=Nematostella vectensis TaxID=45351 RepID=A7RMJ0_NEMVE|nr:predicted protein [Nematostella vectensis]|eukprot:XP_001639341.1 predicted protein [Nematostella vectensis]
MPTTHEHNSRPVAMRAVAMIPLLFMILAALPASLASKVSIDVVTSCPVDAHINGCSVPGDLPFFYKETFTPACRMHDVCYRCSNVFGWKKAPCDSVFKGNMYILCEKKYKVPGIFFGSFRVYLCKLAADLYTKVAKTRELGGGHWDKYSFSKFKWCKMECAEKMGDPSNELRL